MHPDIHLFAGISLPTYFLIISAASIVCVLWFFKRAQNHGLDKITAIDLAMVCLASGFLGARALHVFYEEPSRYWAAPLDALLFWNGGFVFFGGLLASLTGGLAYCQWKKEPFWLWADLAALPAALAYALGRLGCFFNGCCYGRLCDLPWAVDMHGGPRHPTQMYATTWEVALILVLMWREPKIRTPGVLFNLWLFGHALGRITMEAFRDDLRGPMVANLSISTSISLSLGLMAGFNLAAFWAEKRHTR